MKKGQHHLYLSTIKRTKEAPWKQEEFSLVDKLCDWEGKILLSNLNLPRALNAVDEQLLAIEKRYLDLQKKKDALYTYAKLLPQKSTTENTYKVKQFIKTFQKENINNYEGALGKYCYHSTLNILFENNDTSIERLHHAKLVIEALEENNYFFRLNVRLYAGMKYNYSNSLLGIDNTEVLKKFLKK